MSLSQAIKFIHIDRKDYFRALFANCRNAEEFSQASTLQAKYIYNKTLIKEALRRFELQLSDSDLEIYLYLYHDQAPTNYDIIEKVKIHEMRNKLNDKWKYFFKTNKGVNK